MSILNETSTLANGVEIPRLGLGTWFIDDSQAARDYDEYTAFPVCAGG